ELVFGRSPCIGGNFLRPAPLGRPCFRSTGAIVRIAHPLGRRIPGHLLVQPQWIGKRPRSELQKELSPPQRRTHSRASLSTFSLILQLLHTWSEGQIPLDNAGHALPPNLRGNGWDRSYGRVAYYALRRLY